MAGPRTYEREIEDIENHLATLHDHLDLLAALARNVTTDRARRRLSGQIDTAERRIAELQARRRALQTAQAAARRRA